VQYIFARKIDILLANGEKIFKLSDSDAALCNLFSFLSARRHAETDEKKFMSYLYFETFFNRNKAILPKPLLQACIVDTSERIGIFPFAGHVHI
jgi:hypothetical protein